MRVRDFWRSLGRAPSLAAFAVFYGTAVPAGLLLDDPLDATMGAVLFGLFIAYCIARPSHRLDVFLYAAAPGALGTMLHDLFEISRLWGLAALPVTLAGLRDVDREPSERSP